MMDCLYAREAAEINGQLNAESQVLKAEGMITVELSAKEPTTQR